MEWPYAIPSKKTLVMYETMVIPMATRGTRHLFFSGQRTKKIDIPAMAGTISPTAIESHPADSAKPKLQFLPLQLSTAML